MGIPSYYRWLCKKYPRVPLDAKGDEEVYIDGKQIPTDTSTPNPNGVEFDNLYLDMNGIIHPCCHPESGEAPPTEEEMFLRIHKYIDRIFSMVRPRKVLYMAIDGVAPRAKMNQQRQRRFRAAQERAEFSKLDAELRSLFTDTGKSHLIPSAKGPAWDSNVITPGTPFMANLSESLRHYIADRLTNDPGWRNIQVIFSDATVPGEGEHKILHFIRNQRSQQGYNPNTRHCLYGMDADLIMLSLASHEPHFYIVREIVFSRADMICTTCNRNGHHAGECEGLDKETVIRYADSSLDHYISNTDLLRLQSTQENSMVTIRKRNTQPFQFLSISILREYLVHELDFNSQLFDLERAIDDWVFLCFFVGNDFLPHMPALEIRENAIGVMQKIWKSIMISNIKSFEQSIVQQYMNSLNYNEKMRIDPKVLTSSSPDIVKRIPITLEQKEQQCNAIYLTNNGDINLPNLYTFLQKFQLFEAAIYFSKSKKSADAERKQKRIAREEAAAAQIDKDNRTLDIEIDVADSKLVNLDKDGIHPQRRKKVQQNDESNSEQIISPTKKVRRAETDEAANELVQLPNVDSKRLNMLESLLSDVDQVELMKAEAMITGKPMNKVKHTDSPAESDEEALQPTPIDAEDTTTTTSNSPLLKIEEESSSDDENALPINTDEKIEFDLQTGKIVNKIGLDYHTIVPEKDPFKKKRMKGKKIHFGDEYSINNPHIAFQAAFHKLKEKLGVAPVGDIKDSNGNVVGNHAEDRIKLGTKGYEYRYYKQKFHVDIDIDRNAFDHIHLSYITGLRWVFHYYYKGCPSWNWYYPYHYAPLITSLAKIELSQYAFDVSTPLNPTDTTKETRDTHTIITTSLYSNAQPILPFEQLLSVFPSASSHALPPPLARLMVEADSPIVDFYPQEFGLDTMSKKFMWQGVVQLPFIDMERLKRTVKKREHLMTADELERNRHGVNYVFSRFEEPDINNTNNTSLLQVALETDQKLKALMKVSDKTQKIKMSDIALPNLQNKSLPGSTSTIQELIDQYNNLKKLETFLLATRRTNPSSLLKYENEILPQKTVLYRTIRQYFNQAVTQKPSCPITINNFPNLDERCNQILEKNSPHTQYTHDVSQWQYNYSDVLSKSGITTIMLSKVDRLVEPALAQHTSVFARCIDEATNLTYLQGYFGLMCEQLIPGQTILPKACYQTANNDVKPISNSQVVSYIFTVPPTKRHIHALLPGVQVLFKNTPDAAPSNHCLNEKDLVEIGIQKQGFHEYTFEYLFNVMQSGDVYQKHDSSSKDVISFDELGLNDVLNDKKKLGEEVSIFEKLFAGKRAVTGYHSKENYNSEHYHTGLNDPRRGNASHQSNSNKGQIPLYQQQQQQYQQMQMQQQQNFQQNFQNPNMGGYQPLQQPPQVFNPYQQPQMHQQNRSMQPNGMMMQPNMMQPNMMMQPNGMMMQPNMMQPNMMQPNGMMMQPNGMMMPPNGMMMQPNGMMMPPGMQPPPQFGGYQPQQNPQQRGFSFQHPNAGGYRK